MKNLRSELLAAVYMSVESGGTPVSTSMYSWSEIPADSRRNHIRNLSGISGSPFSLAFL